VPVHDRRRSTRRPSRPARSSRGRTPRKSSGKRKRRTKCRRSTLRSAEGNSTRRGSSVPQRPDGSSRASGGTGLDTVRNIPPMKRGRRPVRDLAARAADPDELRGGPRPVGREHDPAAPRHGVEIRVGVGQAPAGAVHRPSAPFPERNRWRVAHGGRIPTSRSSGTLPQAIGLRGRQERDAGQRVRAVGPGDHDARPVSVLWLALRARTRPWG
jgi:hypothetical protein